MALSSANGMPILYGYLHLHIDEARDLATLCPISTLRRFLFTTTPPKQNHSSSNKRYTTLLDRLGILCCYVTVSVPYATLASTRLMPDSESPKWDERYTLPLAHPFEYLEFQVKDYYEVSVDQTIGIVKISREEIASGKLISDWFKLNSPMGMPEQSSTAIRLEIQFTPFKESPLYRHGIAGDPGQKGVTGTYFPLRKGHSLTLYQDAHVTDDCKLPKVGLDDGMVFEQQRCWEDLCYAIAEAHRLIYIVGWAVFDKVKLNREPSRPLPQGGDLTLGELLKFKSEEGVRVLLLVWDDMTSHQKLFIKTDGVMKTHDEQVKEFFKHSSVICILSPRYGGSSKLSPKRKLEVGAAFTHHQKCVLVDTQASGNNRRITAFLGGLDLTDGRYDTPQHRLFHGLDTIFQNDIHQPTFPEGTKAPRQPWHDLHSRIDGPAAYDVLINFAQRWKKATRWKGFLLKKKMIRWHDDSMIKIERLSWMLSPVVHISKDGTFDVPEDDPKLYVSEVIHPESWNIQIFRSIDSGSVKGFPKQINVTQKQNLLWWQKLVIDRSILTAYIQAIRSAQHFIYIENQYFIGSSYAWSSNKDAGADQQIPMELVMKIVSKIRAGERFAVYVVIPMWPEGDPTTAPMQAILFWQSQTMRMMYQIIAQELKAQHMDDSHPQDYLNFYCLGKREEIPDQIRQSSSANGDTKVSNSWKNRRFMIYVHSKGMIVDDEYVILGSANINQRSMAGTNDTEIAMGSYQPHHSWANKQRHPHGQVYGYRMSLWAEHLGLKEEVDKHFEEPETLECVRRVNEVAEDNWKRYSDDNFTPLQGHLLKYPIQVSADGRVGTLPGYKNFPDVGGKIRGTYSSSLPDILTI